MEAYRDPTVVRFIRDRREQCAFRVFTRVQVAWYLLLFAVVVLLFLYDWLYALTIVNFVAAAFYFSVIVYKCGVVLLAVFRKREIVVSAEELAALDDATLPMYTVLVPLYKEPEVASKIIKHIDALDYPKELLDVKLLLEENDEATIEACRSCDLPSYYEMIIVPHSLPKTKPKACNHGLDSALGEFLVIFDAEDRPEPDQLKKAVAAFRSVPDNVACIQAKLNYFNPYQNTLTRWFTIEYTAWFDLYLPGLHALGVPIPLGGTSNHFRTEVLKQLGGWDPFNVTEDCDLGIRLHAEGYRTKVLDSTTWEEANSRLGNWIRQRSRWVKGYFQTHLVHMRNPFKLLRKLGPKDFASFLLTVGGLSIMLVLNPLYWIIGLTYLSLLVADWIMGNPATDALAWRMLYTDPTDDPFWSGISITFFIVTWVLVCANLLFVFINVLACHARDYKKLIPLAFLSPLYWVLISIAALKGFWQLFTNPFYWEKTVHGLGEDSAVLEPGSAAVERNSEVVEDP
ncbi:MAG: hypothetical protein Kow00107_02090 [Planctomycetota bacterium]